MNIACNALLGKITVSLAAMLLMSGLQAHHSDAGLDVNSVVTLEGTIREFVFRNPHVYIVLETVDEVGESVEWNIQSASAISMRRGGWEPDMFQPGDEVIVRAHPEANGKPYGLFLSVERDGVLFERNKIAAIETVAATSLEGTWRGDAAMIGDFTLFFDRVIANEKGLAAQAVFNPLSDENPMANCLLGRPTPSTLASSAGYLSEIEFVNGNVILRNEIFATETTVYMDGRSHPENVERQLHGHSIGWWEGDTLVVETVDFADHRSPYQNGIPSGAQKRVIEKYTLLESGYRLAIDYMLEDPEFMAEPLISRMEWIYSPDFTMEPWDCDEERTGIWVQED